MENIIVMFSGVSLGRIVEMNQVKLDASVDQAVKSAAEKFGKENFALAICERDSRMAKAA